MNNKNRPYVHYAIAQFGRQSQQIGNTMIQPTIEDVIKFATEAHKDQTRSDGSPYIDHPKRVAKRLAVYGFDDFVHQSVAWLHDTIEDCEVTQEEISERFGSDIAICVQGLSNIHPPGTSFNIKQATLVEHVKNMNIIETRVKICDRIDNLSDMKDVWEIWRQRRYASAAINIAKAFSEIDESTLPLLKDLTDLANSILDE